MGEREGAMSTSFEAEDSSDEGVDETEDSEVDCLQTKTHLRL